MLPRYRVVLSQGKEGVGRLRRNCHDRDRGPVPACKIARKSRLAGTGQINDFDDIEISKGIAESLCWWKEDGNEFAELLDR